MLTVWSLWVKWEGRHTGKKKHGINIFKIIWAWWEKQYNKERVWSCRERLACTGSSSTPLHMGHSRSSSTSPWNLATSYPMVHYWNPTTSWWKQETKPVRLWNIKLHQCMLVNISDKPLNNRQNIMSLPHSQKALNSIQFLTYCWQVTCGRDNRLGQANDANPCQKRSIFQKIFTQIVYRSSFYNSACMICNASWNWNYKSGQ